MLVLNSVSLFQAMAIQDSSLGTMYSISLLADLSDWYHFNPVLLQAKEKTQSKSKNYRFQ